MQGKAKTPRHGGHFLPLPSSLHHKHGVNQVIYSQAGFAHQAAQALGAAQATGTEMAQALTTGWATAARVGRTATDSSLSSVSDEPDFENEADRLRYCEELLLESRATAAAAEAYMITLRHG